METPYRNLSRIQNKVNEHIKSNGVWAKQAVQSMQVVSAKEQVDEQMTQFLMRLQHFFPKCTGPHHIWRAQYQQNNRVTIHISSPLSFPICCKNSLFPNPLFSSLPPSIYVCPVSICLSLYLFHLFPLCATTNSQFHLCMIWVAFGSTMALL